MHADDILLPPAVCYEKAQSEDCLLVDVRDADDYKEYHASGSVNIPQIFYHLSTTTDTELKESASIFEELFRRAGVTSDTLVILYEDGLANRFGGSFRGWWWLNFFGHSKVAVMDGGFEAWKQSGLPTDSEKVVRERSNFKVNLDFSVLARRDDVLDAIGNDQVVLLDNRDAREWFAEGSSPYDTPEKDFSPRRGRIPTAKWIEWTRLMDDTASPTFRDADEIRRIMADQGITPQDDIIIYCFKGSRASNTFAALKMAGFTKLRNYLGSWYEWAADPSLPIDTGK